MESLIAGDRVVLHDLSRTELNGKRGTILGRCKSDGAHHRDRWKVEVDGS